MSQLHVLRSCHKSLLGIQESTPEMATLTSATTLTAGENQRDSVVHPQAQSLRLRFAKDVLLFGWANLICLAFNAILTFFLPRYLTIEDFGYYRLFILYTSMAGLLHLGMLEGIIVRWSGKPDERIGPEINTAFVFLVAQHIILLVVAGLALSYWLRTPEQRLLGLGVAIYVIVVNCSMLGQIALQARKQFAQLSFFTILTAAALLIFVVGWKLLGRLDSWTATVSYVAANLLAGVGIWKVVLKPGSARARQFRKIIDFGLEHIHLGWKILLANAFLTITPSLDRFFVSGVFPIREFAIYSFAGNALAVVYTVAISVARVVYPYLSEGTNLESRRRAYGLGRATLLLLWALSLSLYFPIALIVHWVLPKYVSSLPVMRLLMINSGFVSMIHILHANYFRVSLALNRFLAGSVVGVVAAATLLALIRRTANLQWIAGAMTAAIAIWWAANEFLLARDVGGSWRGRIRIFVLWLLTSAAFLAACAMNSPWLGGLTYLLTCIVLLALGLRNTMAPFFAHAFSPVSGQNSRR
jgi:O-antigen/teichoic acid export membrane protein